MDCWVAYCIVTGVWNGYETQTQSKLWPWSKKWGKVHKDKRDIIWRRDDVTSHTAMAQSQTLARDWLAQPTPRQSFIWINKLSSKNIDLSKI